MERCVIGDTRRATLDALHASAVAFEALRYAGVAYLLYMAWMTWCESGALAVDEDSSPRSALRVITSGILVNILNPELTIFFFASCRSSSVPTTRTGRMLEMSRVFMLATLVVFVIYGVFAAAVRNAIVSRPRVMTWLRRTFAVAFVALGARLAVAER